MKNYILYLTAFFFTACTQYTPTMMNTAPAELSHQTVMEQVPLNEVNEGMIATLANHYENNKNGPLDLTLTFDPKSKSFTAMQAVNHLKSVRTMLQEKGVRDITMQTMAVEGTSPTLIVNYDVLVAYQPADCTDMPGLTDNTTTRFLDEYKFGCGVESMLAKQIARPSDLQGNGTLATRGAERDATVVDEYKAGIPRTPLEGIEREDLSTGG